MKTKYKLICMAFDGEYVTEKFNNSIEELQKHSNDLGSKWFFYPYHFICTATKIKEASYGLTHLEGKKITTVQKHFKEISEKPEMQGCNAEEFWFAL